MKNNSFGAGIIVFAVIICILALIGAIQEASTPKCIKSGCNNERASGSSYCYLHKTYPKSNYSSSGKTKSGSSGSGYTSKSSGSSSGGSSSSGSKNYSSKKSSSSSSSSSNRKYYNSYDDGYEDIYENDDFDEDRYRTDSDYASGVDDAMEDVDW
ncbi:MAG: hypothetical protein SOZ28_05310 [Clostridia bacterium]|nr:hypothetical protein [Clostridia bacterium]